MEMIESDEDDLIESVDCKKLALEGYARHEAESKAEEKEVITVKKLITILLDHPLDWEVKLRTKDGTELHGVEIFAQKPEKTEVLGCLFG